MDYKRKKGVFCLWKVLEQIIEYVKENQLMPKTIYLPPEEFVYISYLLPSEHLISGCDKFIGIPLDIYYLKQEFLFEGV